MKKICVIEDNSSIRKLFTTILSKEGYEAIGVSSGQEALDNLENMQPDLILMDILLPDINGTDLIGKVKAFPAFVSTPIIAVTGFSTASDIASFKELGFVGYLEKPINAPIFLAEIKKHLG